MNIMTNDDGATPASRRVPDPLTAVRHSHIFRICG